MRTKLIHQRGISSSKPQQTLLFAVFWAVSRQCGYNSHQKYIKIDSTLPRGHEIATLLIFHKIELDLKSWWAASEAYYP